MDSIIGQGAVMDLIGKLTGFYETVKLKVNQYFEPIEISEEAIRSQSLEKETAEYTEIRRYQASWGDWYVQVTIYGRLLELRFLMEPDKGQVYEAVTSLVEAEKAAPVTLEAEDGEVI